MESIRISSEYLNLRRMNTQICTKDMTNYLFPCDYSLPEQETQMTKVETEATKSKSRNAQQVP